MTRNFIAILAVLPLFACPGKGTDTSSTDTSSTDTSDTSATADIEIAGTYTDNFGGGHVIDDTSWTQTGFGTSVFHISQYDNDSNFAIAQNDAANEYNPSLFSRFDWTTDSSGQLWFCQTAYDAATAADALATAAADTTDPATAGCGGFSWTMLTPG